MNTETGSPSAPQFIDVAAIERELNSLWKDAGKEDEHGGVTRTSVLNLLVYTDSEHATSELDELLTEVTAAHPSRAILIAADRKATEAGVNAQVISRCTLPTATTKQVCCEQVTINTKGKSVNEVHSAVLPLLVSDLPVYLWWRAEPLLADRVFTRLAEMSNRVIIDSSIFADPHGDLVSLAVLLRDRPKWTAISDLNWSRLTAWRQLIAGFYDVPEYRPALGAANRLEIEYASPAGQPNAISPRAALVAGWIAARLGWTLNHSKTKKSGQSATFELMSKTQKIFIEFKPTTRTETEPGHIAKVTLKADSFAEESSDAEFTVTKSSEGTRLETTIFIGHESRPGRVLSYKRMGEAELIGRELEILTRDRVYEQAVLAAGDLLMAYIQA
ncbi:MAG TPA: glucose-6-phosphate dehydrogenase assembly protein OpcA [Blastocatellia bacterium]|nr:glucose-6-phosphate dehydrogenase assembly protein OpcA [Blastocatellia bacterium]